MANHIKLSDLISLNEANVYNKDALVIAIEQLLKRKNVFTNKEIRDWFYRKYIGWYISPKDDDEKDGIVPHEYKEGEPEWAKKEGVYDFIRFDNETINKISHIIDYFEALPENELKKIQKQPYKEIERKIKLWDEELKKNMDLKQTNLKEKEDVETEMKFPDGYRFVRLISKKAYDTEGNQMGHCAAGYAEKNESILYSLKDTKGESHVTLEYYLGDYDDKIGRDAGVNAGITQIKGKENKAPVQKYIPYVKNFIEKFKMKVLEDGQNIGMIKLKNKFYFPNSEEVYDLIKSIVKNHNGTFKNNIDLSGLYLTELPDLSNIKITGDFNCSYNKLTSLQGAPKSVGGNFDCHHNQLASLDGAPQSVGGHFNSNFNKLTSLQGAPQSVGGYFGCQFNELTSLDGAPQSVGRFSCDGNPVKFTQEDIEKAMRGRVNETSIYKYNKNHKVNMKEYFVGQSGGYGGGAMAGGGVAPMNWAGTPSSNQTSRRLNDYPASRRYTYMQGNTVIGSSLYDTITQDDLKHPDFSAQEIMTGLRKEMGRMEYPNKDIAKQTVLLNLSKKRDYYSGLHMYDDPAKQGDNIMEDKGSKKDNYEKQLAMGIKVEKDHFSDKEEMCKAENGDALAKVIAKRHLDDDENYYNKLKAAGLDEGAMTPLEAGYMENSEECDVEGDGEEYGDGEVTPVSPNVAVITITATGDHGQAKLTSSGLGKGGTPVPLKTTNLEAPAEKAKVGPNKVATTRTPAFQDVYPAANGNADPLDHFCGQMIEKW